MEGRKFVLTPRYVLSLEYGGKKKGFDFTVLEAASGKVSATYTFQRKCVSTCAFGDQPWHYDEEAIADFKGGDCTTVGGAARWPRPTPILIVYLTETSPPSILQTH
jgi:hypothetical protein